MRARMEHERPDTLTDEEVDVLTYGTLSHGWYDHPREARVFHFHGPSGDVVRYLRLMPPAGDLWVEWGLILERFDAAR